jgi:flagellar basal body-associated protein FliL
MSSFAEKFDGCKLLQNILIVILFAGLIVAIMILFMWMLCSGAIRGAIHQ